MDEVVRVLSDLVAIPSMNPMDREMPGPEYTEEGMADYVEAYLRKLGVDCERQEVLPHRPNVVGFAEGRNRSETILLEAHMDTVPAEHMEIEPFTPTVKDGRLYGRGSCDTKAALAAMLVALRRRIDAGGPEVSVVLAGAVDEEFKFRGVRHLVESGITATGGMVGEPTGLDIVVAHKGVVRWKVRTRGRSTHSSQPEEGVNAIYRMAPVLSALERYATEELRGAPHPLLGGPTLSVGLIDGGQTVNTVPDFCEIQIDRRTLPGEDAEEVMADVQAYLEVAEEIAFDFEMTPPFLVDLAMELDEGAHIVRRVREACERTLGAARIRGVPYGTDASKLTPVGIPSLVFGPGHIVRAHSAVEYVEIEELCRAVAVYEMVLG